MKALSIKNNEKLKRILPHLIFLLLCLQPILDIVSYWQDALQIPISLSFAPRAIIFALLFLVGLILSDNKKVYWIMLGTVVVFWIAHVAVCWQNGMTVASLIHDTTYFISVLQLPVTAISLITWLKISGEDGFDAIFKGIAVSLAILIVSFIVSNLTKTEPHTYPDRGVGICGYCFWPNAQSAILCICAPITIALVIRKRPQWTVLCIAIFVICLGVLFVHGTRLSFLCMLLTGIGMTVVFLLTKQKKRFAIAMAVVTLIFGGLFYFSPMYANRSFVDEYTEKKIAAARQMYALGEVQIRNHCSPALEETDDVPTGIRAFALPAPLEASIFTDMQPIDTEKERSKIENDPAYNNWQKAFYGLYVNSRVAMHDYEEPYQKYVGYLQTLDLVTSSDKLYNFHAFDRIRVVDILCSATRVYERYTGTKELTGWKNAGENWHDVFIERSKLYNYDGRTLFVGSPWTDCDRATAAELIWRMLPESEFAQVRDIDAVPGMDKDAEHYDAVLTLYRAGVINDLEDGEDFRPNSRIDRLSYCAWLAAAVNPEFRLCDAGYTLTLPEKLPEADPEAISEDLQKQAMLYPVYNYFMYGTVDRFGIAKTVAEYKGTLDPEEIIDERAWKLHFCYLLMNESTGTSRLFGLEADRMVHKGYSYDVENDVHAIYLRFGWVGMALMCAFLLYFIVIILRALIKNPKQIFTLEAGAIGIALLATAAHAYYTCGVLRRANSLWYFGALLAGAYYLVKLKQYPPLPEKADKPKKKKD